MLFRTKLSAATMLPMLLLSAALSAEETGGVSLFNGQDLDGWIQKNGTATYRAENGTIVGKTNEGSPNSFLCTKKDYGDFELEFDVRVDDALNSGVQIRSQTKELPAGKKNAESFGRVNGPQVEIAAGAGGSPSGYIYGEGTSRGWLTPKERLVSHRHFKSGEWNHYRVVAKGSRIQTWINGNPIDDLVDEDAYVWVTAHRVSCSGTRYVSKDGCS